MGLLNHFFGSIESRAREIELDEKLIIKHWKDYLETISEKEKLIETLNSSGIIQSALNELKHLLELELVDISGEEKEESEIISDLELIEHSSKVKRVHKLEQCLGYAETKYEYVYHLLQQLHSFLRAQMHIVNKLLEGSKNAEKLTSLLKLQLKLELEVVKKIDKINTFHDLFSALAKGEHIIQTINNKEKRLLKKMQKGISEIFSNEITEGITYEWAMAVFSTIEDKIHEGVANGMFQGYHPDISFEFVNRPEFVVLVKETIQNLRSRKVSEEMINAFVRLFREWYNHERE